MLQRMIMIILILVIVIGGGFYAYQELMPPPVEETQGPVYATKEVVRGDISVGVETIGELQPSNSGGLRIPGNRNDPNGSFSALIEEYLVEEGEEVKQGQVVAKLSSPDLLTKIESKEQELLTAKEDLARMVGVPVEEVDNVNPSEGITISAPIEGIITDLDIEEGTELKQGTIARIVDNSRYEVEAKLFEPEYKKVKEGQKVVLRFPYFDGQYEGVITKVNPNRIPFTTKEGEFAQSFVYVVTIEGENMGLVQRDMEVRVGMRDENNSLFIHNFANMAKVKGFLKEEKVINTFKEAVVTELHVDEMAFIKKGDPIVTMAGTDTQTEIQEKINDIRKISTELRELKAKLDQLEVVAPMDGIVARFHRPVGESVNSGDWIGHLYTVSDMRMWTQVDDIDVLYVKQGAPVKVTVDALVGKSFEGVVENVSTMGESENGVSKFRVEIKVTGSSELRPGMQAKAFIDAGSSEDTLLVPLEAIFEEENQSMVEVLNDDGVTTKIVPVKLGLMNDRFAEIKSGLEEGDKVVVGSSDDLLPSQHIKSEGGLLPDKSDGGDGNSGDGGEGNK